MAKIQFGSGIAAISGRSAGTVYSHGKAGAYMRRFSVPTNKASPAQQLARQRLATGSAGWRALTAPLKDAWESWAKSNTVIDRLGASILLTGHQAYCAVAANMAIVGLTLGVAGPPAPPAFKTPVLNGFVSTLDSAGVIVLQVGTDMAEEDVLVIAATPPYSPGKTRVSNLMRVIEIVIVPGTLAPGDDLEITAADYQAVHGNLTTAVGSIVTFEGRFYSNGLLSTISRTTAPVTQAV